MPAHLEQGAVSGNEGEDRKREVFVNWITAKYKSECVSCTRNIDEGERILFDFEEREAPVQQVRGEDQAGSEGRT